MHTGNRSKSNTIIIQHMATAKKKTHTHTHILRLTKKCQIAVNKVWLKSKRSADSISNIFCIFIEHKCFWIFDTASAMSDFGINFLTPIFWYFTGPLCNNNNNNNGFVSINCLCFENINKWSSVYFLTFFVVWIGTFITSLFRDFYRFFRSVYGILGFVVC